MNIHLPKRRLLYGIAAFLVLSVLGVLGYFMLSSPMIDGYEARGAVRELSSNAPLQIAFTQPMDKSSVESNFEVKKYIPKEQAKSVVKNRTGLSQILKEDVVEDNFEVEDVAGEFQWSGRRVVFMPTAEIEKGEIYRLALKPSARSFMQRPLESEYEEFFQVVDAPQVVLTTPHDGSVVPVDAKITVQFNRPLVALTGLSEGENLIPDVTIKPATRGRYKWMGTSSFQFIPDELAYATEYEFTIPAGTTAIDGGELEEDYTVKFSTPAPEVVETKPYNFNRLEGPDTLTLLTFNQPVEVKSLNKSVTMWKKKESDDVWMQNDDLYKKDDSGFFGLFSGSETRGVEVLKDEGWEKVPVTVKKTSETEYRKEFNLDPKNELGDYHQKKMETTVTVKPRSSLEFDYHYVVYVSGDVQASGGDQRSGKDSSLSFKTVGQPEVVEMKPEGETAASTRNVEILFSNPMDLESVEKHVTFDPPLKNADGEDQDLSHSLYGDKTKLNMYPRLAPATEYAVTIKKGAEDIYGQKLAEDVQYNFKTGDISPTFSVKSKDGVVVLNGYKNPIFYLDSTNVKGLNTRFKELSVPEFEALYAGGGYFDLYDKTPSDPFITWTQPIDYQKNKKVTTKVDFEQELGEEVISGIYYFDMADQDPERSKYLQKYAFVLSKTNLTYKKSEDQLLVWATDMANGRPVKDMEIVVKEYNDGFEEHFRGFTDEDGLIVFDLNKVEIESPWSTFVVYGFKEGDFAMVDSDWSEGIRPWNFDITSAYEKENFFTYVYTDRPLYRPGQTVNFKGIIRKNDDVAFSLPEIKEVEVRITDSRGNEVMKENLRLNDSGTFNGSVELSESVPTGDFSMVVTIPGDDEESFYSGFKVAEFRKPDYRVELEPSEENYVHGETAKVKIKADYYFGAPLANADVKWTVQAIDYYFNEYDDEWYSFSEEGFFCYWGCEGDTELVTQGRGKLNEQGELEIELPLDIAKKEMSQLYKVEVTAEDITKRSVSNRVTFPVHKGAHYVGITNNDYVLKAGDEVEFDVITVDFDGNPVANKQVEVTLNKRDWNTVRKKNVDGNYYYTSGYEDSEIGVETVKTGTDGKAKARFKPTEGGLYKAIAESSDGQGNFVLAATTAYVSSGDFVFWGRDNNDRIELIPDKQEYKPGETAKVLVKSPYQGVKALVTYERGSILEHKVIDIKSNSEVLEIPVTDEFIPNLFVSVMLVKGSEQTAGIGGEQDAGEDVDPDLAEREIESMKVGYTTLFVDTLSKKLNIELKTDQNSYGPRDKVSLDVVTTNAQGEAVPAEVSIAVVDESLLALTNNATADLINYFYRKRYLSVSTAQSLTKSLARINVMVAQGLKGGGGGADVGGATVRSEFKDLAHWKAVLKTDEKGEGSISFALPDNLTTWRIVAVGVTNETLVGSAEESFVATKDVLVQPVLPRFMVVGDQMEVGVVLHNQSDSLVASEVLMTANGATVTDGRIHEDEENADSEQKNPDYVQTVSVRPGEKVQVMWPITVDNVEEAKFFFRNEYDALSIDVEVAPSSFPEVVATSGSLTEEQKHIEKVWVPNSIDERFGGLTVSMAPTMSTSFADGAGYLLRYPYGCSEQTASSLLPNVVLKRFSRLPVFPDDVVDQVKLNNNVRAGLTRLYKYQNPNGGWGLWENSEPNPYLTAYVLYTMHEATKSGFAVDEKVVQDGVSYLKNYQFENPIEKDDSYNANTRAYILFVLGEMNELDGDLGLANNLFEHREKLSVYAKAMLAMAFDKIWHQSGQDSVKKTVKGKIQVLKEEILDTQKVTPRSVSFEETSYDYRSFDSDGRTNAYVLQMFARIEARNPVVDKLVAHILSARRDGYWRTTQETSITLIGLIEYLAASGELEPAFTASVTANNSQMGSKVFSEENLTERETIEIMFDYLNLNNQDNEIAISKVGEGKLYYDMEMKYFLPLEKLQVRDEGMSVTQEYFAIDDKKEENPLDSFELGQAVKGKMTVVVPADRHYVAVEDLLPAGLEPIDFEFATSEQALEEAENKLDGWYWWNPLWHFNHHEIRNDRIVYFADYLPAGTYEITYFARAATAGEFHDLPAQALEMYTPEVFGRSAGRMVEVTK